MIGTIILNSYYNNYEVKIMPGVVINKVLYVKLEKVAKFLNKSLEEIVETFLDAEMDSIERESSLILEKYLNNEEIINRVFNSE